MTNIDTQTNVGYFESDRVATYLALLRKPKLCDVLLTIRVRCLMCCRDV